jgi:hypothetical protein
MAINDDVQGIDMALRARVMSLCAPIWWESGRQAVVNSGTMCVIKTADAVFGVTNHHVLRIYTKHKGEKDDIFCQLGSGPFDPIANLIDCSEYWDLATFKIPELTLNTFGHKGVLAIDWPPGPIEKKDIVVFGGYPEVRRSAPPRPNPTTMSIDFVSFRARPHHCSPEQVSFHVDPALVTWLPNVYEPLEPGTSLSGMSGGPCFRLRPEEDRIELAGFIYEGDYGMGIIFVRQAHLISAAGQIAPRPF